MRWRAGKPCAPGLQDGLHQDQAQKLAMLIRHRQAAKAHARRKARPDRARSCIRRNGDGILVIRAAAVRSNSALAAEIVGRVDQVGQVFDAKHGAKTQAVEVLRQG